MAGAPSDAQVGEVLGASASGWSSIWDRYGPHRVGAQISSRFSAPTTTTSLWVRSAYSRR